MANTLTALAPTLYAVATEVAAEPAGILDAIDIRINPQAAYGNSVTVPVLGAATIGSYTPAMTTTAGDNNTPTAITISASANAITSFNLTGEDQLQLDNGSPNRIEFVRQATAQCLRTLRNAASAAADLAVKNGASRAIGTAGTTPFATDLSDLTAVKKILVDNGAPLADLQCIINSAAYLNLCNLGIIQQANLAGSDAERRSGLIGRQFGFKIAVDNNIAAHTPGAPSGTKFTETEPVGVISLAYDGDSNGPWAAGDVVTFGSGGGAGTADTRKYIVYGTSTATPVIINAPGLFYEHVDEDTMTIGAAYTPSFAFERQAVVGFVRAPVIPAAPNMQQIPISDTKTGLTFLLCQIIGDGMVTYRFHLMYGFKVINSAFVATILG